MAVTEQLIKEGGRSLIIAAAYVPEASQKEFYGRIC
jgi:hypothetical protein